MLYVIEVNPRSSRTIPYISKVTGVPMIDLAVRSMVGTSDNPEKPEALANMGFGTGLYRNSPYFAVKVPVFSFAKLIDVDNQLGPEMKSTGEVLGIANTLEEALYKGISAAGYNLKKSGGVLFTVRDIDKDEMADVAAKFHKLGFKLYATKGTAERFISAELPITVCTKGQAGVDMDELIDGGMIDYVVSTSRRGRTPTKDSVRLRRKAIERSIPCLTSVDTASALADSLLSRYSAASVELVNINDMRHEKLKYTFTKMTDCGNDYIYFNCFEEKIYNPEGLAVSLSDRHNGIGADGVILIEPDFSKQADARMRMFNRDGSEGKMAGNAIRCVAKYLFDNGIVKKTEMKILTASGVKELSLTVNEGKVSTVCVKVAKAELSPESIPVNIKAERVIGKSVQIGGKEYEISCVSVGNPHCVIFCEGENKVSEADVAGEGSVIEHCGLFPERTNVEFCKVINPDSIIMRVWEEAAAKRLPAVQVRVRRLLRRSKEDFVNMAERSLSSFLAEISR